MARFALPYPVLPDKNLDDVRRISSRLAADPEAYAESRRRGGVTMERTYFQRTPMGNFVVAYLETTVPIEEALAAPARSDLDIDRAFVKAVREVHGVDLTQPPPGPLPQTVAEWVDPQVTVRRRGLAFTAPLVPGTGDRGRAWAKETFASEGMTRSRRALGQNLEVMTVVQTPQGPVCAVYIEGEDPVAANQRFAVSADPFDVAFKDELKQLMPPFIDFNKPLTGITQVFDSEELLARA